MKYREVQFLYEFNRAQKGSAGRGKFMLYRSCLPVLYSQINGNIIEEEFSVNFMKKNPVVYQYY